MPIRPELRPPYPWRELSSHVRFKRAQGRCPRCCRPHPPFSAAYQTGAWITAALSTPAVGAPAPRGRRYRKATTVCDYLFIRQTQVAKYFNRTPS
jgi:hypothetical protein